MKKITFAALAVPLMWVLLLLLLFSSNKVYAQEQQVVSGVVKDADGLPLEGVTVWQKETNNGTQTNDQGFYTLEIASQTAVTFEYLGYKTQTLKVTGKILNVTLTADDDMLDEVVINAGYYTVKDKERTGSISKITAKEIGQQPVANPLAAMQGRMAGVNITQSSGTPGGGFDIQIRGRNSLRTEGNAPLYIVDGVPYGSQSVSNADISVGIIPSGNVSPLNSINPNDIESIEVLKDADATAIYGSRGSNGVVLITTKKGSSDKTTFSLQSTTSVSMVSKFMDLMNTEEYLKMRRDAFANDGITEYPANAYDVNGTWDENRYTDWQKTFIGNKAVSQNTQFSIGGGAGKTNYLFGASHRKDGTVFPGDFGYKRTNFSLNVNHKSKDEKLTFQVNVFIGNQNNSLMATDFTNHLYLSPNAPSLYESDGKSLNWQNNTFQNPLAYLNAVYDSKTGDINASGTVKYKLSKFFEAQISSGFTNLAVNELNTLPHTIYNPAYGLDSSYSSLNKSNLKRESWIFEPKILWEKEIGEGVLNVLVGSTFEERKQQLFSISATNFTSNDFIFNASNALTKNITKDSESFYRYIAVFGRLNYNIKDKYIVNVTGRRDGSSRFGSNNRFANFGAVGAAWLFSREKLLENNLWLNFGKIRASYGIAGSDLIGDYQYLNSLGITASKYDGNVGLQPLRLYNPDFSWETNKKIEVALELEFLNGRVAPTISWYRNRSSNQLVGIPLPGTTGFSTVNANLNATVENSGYEFTLRSTNSLKALKWQTFINVTIPKNKLISFPNLNESSYADQYVIGKPTRIRKLYNYLGVNKETGLFDFEDVNNDGKIDAEDRTVVVNLGSEIYGGLQNSFEYLNWSLDILIQFVKQKQYTPDYNASYLGTNLNRSEQSTDYYSVNNPSARHQIPTSGKNLLALQANENYKQSTGVVEDASFIKLKTVQLQYLLSKQWFKSTDLRVFFQAHNLFTLTRYWGLDPETGSIYLPPLRTIAVGFNLNF